jgi:DNA modification methylase
MEITLEDIDKLIPYARNPRKNQNVKKVAVSIKEFGFRQPIVVDKQLVIIAGHTRYEASKQLGLKKVPIHIAKELTPVQIAAYRIADNRVAQDSEWDIGLLNYEFTDLLDENYDLDLLGFDPKELEDLIVDKENKGLTDEDVVPEVPDEPTSKLGDVYQLGNHRLMCGDSTNLTNIEKLMNGEKADMVFTDPPYGMSFCSGRSTEKGALVKGWKVIEGDNKRDVDLIVMIKDALLLAKQKSKEESSFYICFTWRTYAEFDKALKECDIKIDNLIVWDKKSIGIGNSNYRFQHEFIFYSKGKWYGDKAQSDIWSMSRGATSKYVHPTQKPVELISMALQNSSKNGDVILDLFGGSGSTLIACEKLSRKARVMELDAKYVDVIIKRWEDYTGKKAELVKE